MEKQNREIGDIVDKDWLKVQNQNKAECYPLHWIDLYTRNILMPGENSML